MNPMRNLAVVAIFLATRALYGATLEMRPCGGNDTPSVTAAIAEMKDGDTLCFKTGVYHFHPDGGTRRRLLPSGSKGGDRLVGMCFEGRSNVTIDGGNSTFVWHGDVSPFAFLRCHGVKIRNFTSTQGSASVVELVVEAKDDNGFIIRTGNPGMRVENGAVVFKSDLGEYSSAVDGKISLHAISRMLIGYLFVGDAPGPRDGLPSWHMATDVEDLGGGRLRFRYRSDDLRATKCPFKVGETLGVNLEVKRERCVIFCESCSDVVFRDVTLRRSGGMGFVAQMCDNVAFAGCKVLPEEGEAVSLTADCVFIVNCRGEVSLTDCEISHAFDDAMNCHGNYTRVVSSEGCRATVRLGYPEHRFAFPFRVGDAVEFHRERTFETIAVRRISSIGKVSEDGMRVELGFAENLPDIPVDSLAEDVTAYPNVTIRGCNFHDTLHLRLSGRGKYVVEGNRFTRGAGILVVDLLEFWSEAGRIADMTIRNNVFDHFNSMGGESFVFVGVDGCGVPVPNVHRGLVVTNNVYTGLARNFCTVRGAVDPIVRDNWECKEKEDER